LLVKNTVSIDIFEMILFFYIILITSVIFINSEFVHRNWYQHKIIWIASYTVTSTI